MRADAPRSRRSVQRSRLPAAPHLSIDELGVESLTAMEDVAGRYLVRFRKMSMFVDDGEVVNPPN